MPEFPARKRPTAVWLLFVAVFVLYLFQADRVYHAASGKSHLVRLPAGAPSPARGDLKMSNVFDYTPVNNKFEEGKEYQAKIYDMADTQGHATVRVFFRSPVAVYELAAGRRSLWAHDLKDAVTFFASTTGLKPGIYTLGLAVTDDNGTRMSWFDNFFEKKAGGPVKYVARPVDLAPGRVREDLVYALEGLRADSLSGWVVLAGTEMNDCNAYVVVTDRRGYRRAYYAPLYSRRDVAEQRGDPRAVNSGFKINFPENEFPPGTYAVQLAVQARPTGEVFESAQKTKVRR